MLKQDPGVALTVLVFRSNSIRALWNLLQVLLWHLPWGMLWLNSCSGQRQSRYLLKHQLIRQPWVSFNDKVFPRSFPLIWRHLPWAKRFLGKIVCLYFNCSRNLHSLFSNIRFSNVMNLPVNIWLAIFALLVLPFSRPRIINLFDWNKCGYLGIVGQHKIICDPSSRVCLEWINDLS